MTIRILQLVSDQIYSIMATSFVAILLIVYVAEAFASPFQGSEKIWSTDEVSGDVFRAVKDLNDNPAWEYIAKPRSKLACKIRMRAGPDPLLLGMNKDDVWTKIKEVKNYQSSFCRGKSVVCITDGLYRRKWISNFRIDKKVPPLSSANIFSVVQFNTLAEGLSSGPTAETAFPMEQSAISGTGFGAVNENNFGGFDKVENPEICLDFQLRRWRLIEAILGGNGSDDDCSMFPDVIALEEVDHYHSFFHPVMSKFGYEGIFVPKRNSPCIRLGYYSDGCALFWKSDVFELMQEQKRQYDKGGQVYILATLRHRQSDRCVVFGSTHLKAKKGLANEKVRTSQAKELFREAKKVAKSLINHGESGDVPIIVMGDFNADIDGNGATCVTSIANAGFFSAYPFARMVNAFTTFKTRGSKTSKHTIDYIFHNGVGVNCTHTLDLPSEDNITEPAGLPGFCYPSDHIMIGSRFLLAADNS